MAILSLADLSTYAPGISNSIDQGYLTALIDRVQAYAESPMGAGRKLEVTEYKEIARIGMDYTGGGFSLQHAPVLQTPTPVVEQLIGGVWTQVSGARFTFEEDGSALIQGLQHWGAYSMTISASYPQIRLRITYTAGFDFSTPSTDVNTIKAIAGNLAQTIYITEGAGNAVNSATAGGSAVEEYSVSGGESLKMSSKAIDYSALALASSGKLQEMIKQILHPLKRYAPAQEVAN